MRYIVFYFQCKLIPSIVVVFLAYWKHISGFGMMLAVLAMMYAGVLEIVRKNDMTNHGYIQQVILGDNFNASKISMFAQIPEFALIGSSEVFTSISGLRLTIQTPHLWVITKRVFRQKCVENLNVYSSYTKYILPYTIRHNFKLWGFHWLI